jgi:hypothetical protein
MGEAGRPQKEPLGLSNTLASNEQYSGQRRFPDFDRLRQEMRSWRLYYLDPRKRRRTRSRWLRARTRPGSNRPTSRPRSRHCRRSGSGCRTAHSPGSRRYRRCTRTGSRRAPRPSRCRCPCRSRSAGLVEGHGTEPPATG